MNIKSAVFSMISIKPQPINTIVKKLPYSSDSIYNAIEEMLKKNELPDEFGEEGLEEQSDVTEEIKDAIDEKKEESTEETESESSTLMDFLAQDDEEEVGQPTTAPPAGVGTEEELPPLPAGAVG